MNSYTIKLSTIMRDSGTLEAKENYENVRRIDEALDELKEKKFCCPSRRILYVESVIVLWTLSIPCFLLSNLLERLSGRIAGRKS